MFSQYLDGFIWNLFSEMRTIFFIYLHQHNNYKLFTMNTYGQLIKKHFQWNHQTLYYGINIDFAVIQLPESIAYAT